MSVEFAKIFVKDSIKLNILREVMAGKVKLGFTLNNSAQNYASDIHSDQTRVKVFGSFNLSEDPAGEIITIRVFVVDSPLKISLTVPENLPDKNISLFRSATKSIENTHELTNRTQAIEFIPGQECYVVKIHEEPIESEKLQHELDEIKSRVEIGERIINHYDNTEAITKIFNEIKPKLSEAESQIRTLIEAREALTARIESAIK